MPDDKLFEQFKEKRKDISELRARLNAVNEAKENCYSQKEEVSNKIRDLIKEIKELKAARNDLTAVVRKNKADKEVIVADIKSLISKIGYLRKMKNDAAKKHNIRGDPMRIKKQIESLELKVETEVQSFDKEQALMKKIRDLRSKFGDFSDMGAILEDMNELSSEIDDLKSNEKEFKKNVRKNARESQKKHEKMLELSKQVDELKVQEKHLYTQFLEHKKEFTQINNNLKALLSEFGKIKDGVDGVKEQKKRERVQRDKDTIEDKRSRVNEKIKRGEKLTTEDLLVFQGDM